MDDGGGGGGGRRFVILPPHGGGGGGGFSGEAVGSDFTDEADVVDRREEVEVFRPADLGVGEDAIAEEEPAGSPSLAVISPLIENSGHRGLRSPPRNAIRSAGRKTPRPRQRRRLRLRRVAPDPRTLKRDAAQRVHFLHSHFRNLSLSLFLSLISYYYFTSSLEQKLHFENDTSWIMV